MIPKLTASITRQLAKEARTNGSTEFDFRGYDMRLDYEQGKYTLYRHDSGLQYCLEASTVTQLITKMRIYQ